jgi:hypothetical protein
MHVVLTQLSREQTVVQHVYHLNRGLHHPMIYTSTDPKASIFEVLGGVARIWEAVVSYHVHGRWRACCSRISRPFIELEVVLEALTAVRTQCTTLQPSINN